MHPFFIIGAMVCSLAYHFSSAQAIIVVKNDHKPAEIKQQAAYYAQTLNLDTNVYILISFSHQVPRNLGGFTRYQDARAEEGGHQIHITISRKAGRASQMHTLAHEMVHAQQFIEGRLVQCDLTHYRWKEQTCKKVKSMAYLDRPWEKEASEVGTRLYNRFREKSRKRLVSFWHN
ncbi:MAG: hypothetical protein AAF223_08340 [Bacteroidota bacterium]